MKEEFSDYLKNIGIIELYYERSVEIYNIFSELSNKDILDIFVSNYVDSEGKDNFQDMILFTEDIIFEAYNYLNNYDFYINHIKNCPLSGLELKVTDYDFKNASDKSRINCRLNFERTLSIEMKASKQNCDYLNNIIKKYFA